MEVLSAGYKEIEHTADWALLVWAPDLPTLFVQAAIGMGALAEVKLDESQKIARSFTCSANDTETLLVAFLEELLYIGEQENIGFYQYSLKVDRTRLEAKAVGAPILSRKKEIKAVTFHGLEIVQNENGYQVEIVFDV
jgi:SHS2 domain-containing protein